VGINYNPTVTTDGLELSLDFGNKKNYSYNVHPYPINITQWMTVNSGATNNCTISTDSTQISPVGGTPMKMVVTSNDPYITSWNDSKWNLSQANVGETWTASVWVKANTAVTIETPVIFEMYANNVWTGIADSVGIAVDTQWKRISRTRTLTNTNTGFIQVRLDGNQTGNTAATIWWDGLQVEKSSAPTEFNSKTNTNGNTVTESLSSSNFVFHGDGYWSHANGGLTFERTTHPTAKYGGGCRLFMTGNLTASNFLYRNHTWEIWFRINDRSIGDYGNPSIEGYSTLALYTGYHAGFMYTGSTLQYVIWSDISGSPACASWTLGASGSQINQGSWYQVAVTRTGNVFTPYVNGVQLGSGTTTATSNAAIQTTNALWLGKTNAAAANTGQYLYYSKNTIGSMKMYTRALSAFEILQNFNALRGRYGI